MCLVACYFCFVALFCFVFLVACYFSENHLQAVHLCGDSWCCHVLPVGGSIIHLPFTSSFWPSIFIMVHWIQGILFWVGLPDLGKIKIACPIKLKLQVNKESLLSKSMSQILCVFFLATLILGEGSCGWRM